MNLPMQNFFYGEPQALGNGNKDIRCCNAAAEILKTKSQAAITFELVDGTHFSPILPRLERAFEVVYG